MTCDCNRTPEDNRNSIDGDLLCRLDSLVGFPLAENEKMRCCIVARLEASFNALTKDREESSSTCAAWLIAILDDESNNQVRPTSLPDLLLAIAACCNNARAVKQVTSRITAVIKKVARSFQINPPSVADAFYSRAPKSKQKTLKKNPLCGYVGQSRLDKFIQTVVYRYVCQLARARSTERDFKRRITRETKHTRRLEVDTMDEHISRFEVHEILKRIPYAHSLAIVLSFIDELSLSEISVRMKSEYEKQSENWDCESRAWGSEGGLSRWFRNKIFPHFKRCMSELIEFGKVSDYSCKC